MKWHELRIRLMIVIAGCLLLTPLALWAQQPKSAVRYGWRGRPISRASTPTSPGVQAWYCRVISSIAC